MPIDLFKGTLKEVGATRQQVLTPLSPQGFSKEKQRRKMLVQSFLKAAKMEQERVVKVFNHSETSGGSIQ